MTDYQREIAQLTTEFIAKQAQHIADIGKAEGTDEEKAEAYELAIGAILLGLLKVDEAK